MTHCVQWMTRGRAHPQRKPRSLVARFANEHTAVRFEKHLRAKHLLAVRYVDQGWEAA